MKVDSGLLGISDLSKVGAAARELEAQGFDALVTAEVDSDQIGRASCRERV